MNRRYLLLALAALSIAAIPAAHAAAADTITVVQRQTDVNPGETNPCTGATGTIVDDEQDVFHITTLANGRLELTGHGTTAVSFIPDDPGGAVFSGHETYAFSAAGGPGTFTTTLATQVRVRGTDGSFLTLREVAHATVTATGVSVDFDRATMSCS